MTQEKIILKKAEEKQQHIEVVAVIEKVIEKIEQVKNPTTEKAKKEINKLTFFVDSLINKKTVSLLNSEEIKKCTIALMKLDKLLFSKVQAASNFAGMLIIIASYNTITDHASYNYKEININFDKLIEATTIYNQLFYCGYTSNLSLTSSNEWDNLSKQFINEHQIVFTLKYLTPNNVKRQVLEEKHIEIYEPERRQETAETTQAEAETILASFGYTLKDIGL